MPLPHLKRHILTGLLTIIPLWVTWVVFKFVLTILADIGKPVVAALSSLSADSAASSHLADALNSEWISFPLALLLTLALLYGIGSLAHRVIGKRLFGGFDALLERIPLVQTIYGGTKKLLSVLQQKPSGMQRVVLIDFPHPGTKAIGLVTRILREEPSGREMAAVFIPTTPNPTGGYLVIVPAEKLTPTDWTMDQAMAFVISGGAVAPDTLPPTPNDYRNSA